MVGIALNRYGNQNMVLVPMKDKTTKSVKDLKGKTVGAQMGTGTWATWMTYLSRIGMSDKDFKIRNTKTGSLPAAFERGALDAGLTWEPWGSIIVGKGLGRMVMGPKDYDDLLGYTSPVFLTTSWSYIKKKNPDGAQRFINAHVRAMKFLNRNRDESAKLMHEFWKSQGFKFDVAKVKTDLYKFHALGPRDDHAQGHQGSAGRRGRERQEGQAAQAHRRDRAHRHHVGGKRLLQFDEVRRQI